jgi:hypothetical protein
VPDVQPPWALRGETVLAWVWTPAAVRPSVPVGLRALPGWSAVAATSYVDSPVGPYLELSVAVPARVGLRPGLCVTTMVQSSAAARVGCRSAWGLPAELGTLRWSTDDGGSVRSLVWEERGIEVRGVPVRWALPAVVPVRGVQRRADGPVVVPRRFFALTRLARVTVTVGGGPDDPLWWVAGPHPGAVMSSVRMLVRPARRPAGLWSSLRAPLTAPEPALVEVPPAAA